MSNGLENQFEDNASNDQYELQNDKIAKAWNQLNMFKYVSL